MELFYKHYPHMGSGAGAPLIILHGLFGNQGNWALHAKRLSECYSVYAFDARNHGRSAWRDTMSYQEMAEDLSQTMDSLGLESAHFIAHSMGGKTAMQLAMLHPRQINKLIIVDIAPVDYPSGPYSVLEGLQAVDLPSIVSRAQVDKILSEYVFEKGVRDFLLSNLKKDATQGYRWRFNLKALVQGYPEIKGGLNPEGVFNGEVLFIKGSNSDYIQSCHKDKIVELFPKAKVKIIENAGHWVHSEKPDAFLKVVENSLGI